MRVAALYDIHGNLPALEAVLAEIRRQGVGRIVVGGDVLPGPMPRESLACLLDLDLPVSFIMGNGEAAVLDAIAGHEPAGVPEAFRHVIRWTAEQLHADQRREIARWPKTLRLEIDDLGAVLFCHATPRSDTEIFTRITPEERLLPIFEAAGAPLVVCGHTHMAFVRVVGRTRVVNAGSVGMPFGATGADWLLLGPDVDLRHTSYDLGRAADRIRTTGAPQADEFAARDVLRPRSQAEMLRVFSPVTCRPAEPADVAAAAGLRRDGEAGGASADRMSRYLAGEHHPQHALAPRAMWVALDGGTLVGYVAGHLTRRFACDGELQWIYVVPAYRRLGVGSSLIRLLAGWFRERGARRVCVDVGEGDARPFYRRHGAVDLAPRWMVWNDMPLSP